MLDGGLGLAVKDGVLTLEGDAPAWAWAAVTGVLLDGGARLRVETLEVLTPPPSGPPDPALPETLMAASPSGLEAIRERADLVRRLRGRLDGAGFVEVVTPMLQAAAECGQVAQVPVRPGRGKTLYLRTDPEEYLKRYLAAGLDAIYEISTNVRADAGSPRHLFEFQSLEFYRRQMDFPAAIALAEALIGEAMAAAGEGPKLPPIPRIRFAELIATATGVDVLAKACADVEGLQRAIGAAGIALEVEPGVRSWRRAWLEALMDAQGLATQTTPIWVTHYPSELALSARLDPADPRLALRAELFFPGGLEVAHVYENLVEGAALRDRYEERRRHRLDAGLTPVPLNADLMRSADGWLPPMSGGAIGLDRLLMLARGDAMIGAGLLFGREVVL